MKREKELEMRCVIKYTVKVNGKEFIFDDYVVALDLVEATYETCRVVFAESTWETGKVIDNVIDFTELCEMYD